MKPKLDRERGILDLQKFYEKIVKHPKPILLTFAILFVICVFCKPLISVNYDMNDYLPENSKSTISLNKMKEEFKGEIPNARVMIKNVSIPEALKYKQKILDIDGVEDVNWLDNEININQPIEFIDKDILDNYYKDRNALFIVTISENKRIDVTNEIRKIIGNENSMTGSAVSTATATVSTIAQIPKIAIFGVFFALFVLFITTTSFAEPLIIMIGIGVAVIINGGSNIFFGEISFVTNAAGSILQLAVSLDYSVFLLHRFEEFRGKYDDPKEAMINALKSSTSSILSSGMTTVIGFLALCLMRFKIGPDLGLALAKGIAISLVTVFVFMPVFILSTYKYLDKTRHKKILPSFRKFGFFVKKVMMPLLVVFIISIVPSYLASNSNSFYYGASHIFGNNTKLGQDTEKIESVFGKRDTYVLMVPNGNIAKQEKLSASLHKVPEVKHIISYVDSVGETIPNEFLDQAILEKLRSKNYTRFVLNVDTDFEGEHTTKLIDNLKSIIEKHYTDNWYLAGEGISTYDLMNTVKSDMVKVNFIAIFAVFIVLLITSRSLLIPVILVLGIETAIWINLSIPYFGQKHVFYIAYLIISTIQLGATVDYAILFTERYREFRESFYKKDAIVETIDAVTVSILTSGSALSIVGFLLGKISTHGLLSQLGYFLAYGTVCSLIVVLFVLPAMLYVLDGVIQKTTKNINFLN